MGSAWTSDGDGEAVAVTAFKDTVLRKSLRTLQDGVWLGDEVKLQAVGGGGELSELSPLLHSSNTFVLVYTTKTCLKRSHRCP